MSTRKFEGMDWDVRDPTLYCLIAVAHRRAEAIAEDALFELGLTPVDARVLGVISLEDDRAHATGLARRAGLPVSTVTRALRRLERIGYVELHKGSAFDARRLRAVLTAVGRRVRPGAREFEHDVDVDLTEGMSELVKGALCSGLLHIAHARGSDATPDSAKVDRSRTGRPRRERLP